MPDTQSELQDLQDSLQNAINKSSQIDVSKVFEQITDIMNKNKEAIIAQYGAHSSETKATSSLETLIAGFIIEMKRTNDLQQEQINLIKNDVAKANTKSAKIKDGFSQSKEKFSQTISGFAQKGHDALVKIGQTIVDKAHQVTDTIKEAANKTLENVKQFSLDRKVNVLKAVDRATVKQLSIQQNFHKKMQHIQVY